MSHARTYKFVRLLKIQTTTYKTTLPEDNFALCVPLPGNDGKWYTGFVWPRELFHHLTTFQTYADFGKWTSYEGLSYISFFSRDPKNPLYRITQNDLFIEHMHNYSDVQHIGTAQHEIAFRMSLLLGAEGRVALDASYNSHTFHYINGFKSPQQEINQTLDKLLQESKKTKKPADTRFLHGQDMSMTPETITEKLKKLKLPAPAETPQELRFVYLPEETMLAPDVKLDSTPLYRLAFTTQDEANSFLSVVKKGRIVSMADLHTQDKTTEFHASQAETQQQSPLITPSVAAEQSKKPQASASVFIMDNKHAANTIAHLQSIAPSNGYLTKFDSEANWRQIKSIAQSAITQTNDYIAANPNARNYGIWKRVDHRPILAIKQAAQEFLDTELDSPDTVKNAYYLFIKALVEQRAKLKDYFSDISKKIKADINSIVDLVLGTTLQSNHRIFPIETYIENLRMTLNIPAPKKEVGHDNARPSK